MKASNVVMCSALALVLVGCENPAEKSSRAEVSDAVEIKEGDAVGQRWVLSEGSKLTFIGSKVTGSHVGGFSKFSGHFYVNGDTLAPSGHEVVIDMSSVYSDEEKLTGHLKSPDFFDVERFPESKFVVSGLESAVGVKGETHALTGNLTLHGVTKSIEIPVLVVQSDEEISVKADFFINRLDFGISYPGKQDDLIRKEVVIQFDLKAKPESL